MITFRQLRKRLSESFFHQEDIFGLFEEWFYLFEESTFYVYRTDTNTVLARGVQGFEAAKTKAKQLRKQLGLKWDQVKFKVERSTRPYGTSTGRTTYASASGQQGRIDYARTVNPSKGRRFRGYYTDNGEYHDID
jgi:hypothetical protein